MKKLISFLAVSFPAFALAQTQPITDINGVSTKLIDIGDTVIDLLISVAVIYIIINVVKYIISGSAEGKGEAGKHIFFSIVGLAIILSIWGLVNILTNTFRTVDTQKTIPVLSNGPQPFVR